MRISVFNPFNTLRKLDLEKAELVHSCQASIRWSLKPNPCPESQHWVIHRPIYTHFPWKRNPLIKSFSLDTEMYSLLWGSGGQIETVLTVLSVCIQCTGAFHLDSWKRFLSIDGCQNQCFVGRMIENSYLPSCWSDRYFFNSNNKLEDSAIIS